MSLNPPLYNQPSAHNSTYVHSRVIQKQRITLDKTPWLPKSAKHNHQKKTQATYL
jgi:hypothetical protein